MCSLIKKSNGKKSAVYSNYGIIKGFLILGLIDLIAGGRNIVPLAFSVRRAEIIRY